MKKPEWKREVLVYLRTTHTDEGEALRHLHNQRISIYAALDALHPPGDYELTEIVDRDRETFEPTIYAVAFLCQQLDSRVYDVVMVANPSVLATSQEHLTFVCTMMRGLGAELLVSDVPP